ncbi:MAG: hypothetical protein HQM01_14090 [Magnetococcales bacterium]|nr:hypothetical protein [Magnetococcales bacterium]
MDIKNASLLNWPPLGTGQVAHQFFYFCSFVFLLFMIFVTIIPQSNRHYFPVKATGMNYLHRVVQAEECFFQDCPALQDIKSQVWQTSGAINPNSLEQMGQYFPTYFVLHSSLVYAIKTIFNITYLKAYFIFNIFGSILVAIGISYFLLSLFGPSVAGLAVICLIGLDGRMPEHGFSLIAPGSVCIGTTMFFWGILIRRRGDVGGWILAMILVSITLHQIGVGLSGISLAGFLLLQRWPWQRRNILIFLAGIAILIFYLLLPKFITQPVIGIDRGVHLFSLAKLLSFTNLSSSWTHIVMVGDSLWELFSLNRMVAVVIVLIVFGITLFGKNYAFNIYFIFISGLCLVTILFTNAQVKLNLFDRYWIVMAILLLGAVVVPVCYFAEFLLFINRRHFCLSGEQTTFWTRLSRSSQELILVCAYFGLVVLSYFIHLSYIDSARSVPSPVDKIKDLSQRANYPFDPGQPALLRDKRMPCNKVFYINAGENYVNDATQMMVFAYLMEGAIRCGALLYSTFADHEEPKNTTGREFIEQHRNDITHIAFVNVVHTSPIPLSVRQGDIRFRFWKESGFQVWRFLLKNPGSTESRVHLQSVDDHDGPDKALASYTLPPGWEGWVEAPIPVWQSDKDYRLTQEHGGDAWLRGLRLGNEPTDLYWPWDQGIEMRFTNYIIENKKRLEVMHRTTRFTVSELTPEFPVSGKVVADRGMSALALVTPAFHN